MEIVIFLIIILLLLLSFLISFKRKVKNLASEIYEMNYDSVTFDDLIDEIQTIKKQKFINSENKLYRFFNHPLIKGLRIPFIICLYLLLGVLVIFVGMFVGTLIMIVY